jgi:hypothetical protein
MAMKSIPLITLLAFGCSHKAEDSGAAVEITGPTHTVWGGWNHSWEMLSHRVSLIEVRPGEGTTASSGILGGDWSTGDTWSDEVNHTIHQQHVTGNQLELESGSVTLSVPAEGSATTLASLELSEPDLVILQGFTINTDTPQSEEYPDDYDPALGYTSRGFGFSVALTDSGDVTVTANVRWGPRDRDDMNRALEAATTEVTVHYAALYGVEESKHAHYSGAQDLAHDPPNSEQASLTEDLTWSGFGVAAIQSFNLLLHDTDGGPGGDYLRSFGVEIPPGESGQAPETLETEILTSSVLELGTMSMQAEADLVWIPLSPEHNAIQGVTVEGTHPVGSYTVPLD